jgi:hypothetical protein
MFSHTPVVEGLRTYSMPELAKFYFSAVKSVESSQQSVKTTRSDVTLSLTRGIHKNYSHQGNLRRILAHCSEVFSECEVNIIYMWCVS